MKLTQKQKNAIENLISLAGYMKDSTIYSEETGDIIDRSIEVASKLIGLEIKQDLEEEEYSDYLVNQVKKKFKP